MVEVFITFSEKGHFKNREVIFPEYFKRLEDNIEAEDWAHDGSLLDYPTRSDIARMRSGYFVFVYTGKLEKKEKMDLHGFAGILTTIFGRYGVVLKTRYGEYYALIPKWGYSGKIIDKNGLRYDVVRAITYYAKNTPWVEIWGKVNSYRKKHGKPPIRYPRKIPPM